MEIIGHIDFDAFFASVEERDRPWLKGLPVVVGSDPYVGRGAVATANYEARKYGIHSAMGITRAYQISETKKKDGEKEVIFITPSHRKYGSISKEIFLYIHTFVPKIQKVSIDEAYLDLSHFRSYKQAGIFAKKLQRAIQQKYKLGVSIGIGPNRMIAKIASEENKPKGLCVITPRQVQGFLDIKPIRTLPGVGVATERKLAGRGIRQVKDIRECSWEDLEDLLGAQGISLYQKAHGMGSANIYVEPRIAKSISEEETFVEDTLNLRLLTTHLERMVNDIVLHMSYKKVKTVGTVAIKIRFADFETHTMQTTVSSPTSSKRVLYSVALKLLIPFLESSKNPKKKKIRLIGISVSNLIY